MARLKPPKPPTPEQAPRCGIDTLYFTSDTVTYHAETLLPWLQTYIDPAITDEHLTIQTGNGFYQQCISIAGDIEDLEQLLPPFTGTTTELLRIYFNPRPQGDKLYPNNTTSFQLKGELLRRINYMPVLEWIRDNNARVTVLHLFKDDFDYLLSMPLLHNLCSVSSYDKHLQSPLVKSYLNIFNGENSIYLNTKGKKQVHFYNKALQLGEKFQHVRCEVKLSKDNRFNTGLVANIANGEPMEPIISSIISKYVSLKPDGTGRINDRQSYPWWTQFVESATPVKRKDFLPVVPAKKPVTWEKLEEKRNKILQQLESVNADILAHPDHVEY